MMPNAECRAIVFLVMIFFSLLPAFSFAGDASIVDPSVQYQTWEGWGTSLAWFAHVFGGAPDEARNRIADLLFDPKKGLGLNIARYNIGGGENPKYGYLQPRATIPGYESSQGQFDWNQDSAQRWFLDAAMTRGVDQIEAFSNSPPYWMTASGGVTGSTDGVSDNLKSEFYDAFVEYLATVIEDFGKRRGILFRSIDPFNEPSAFWWKFGGSQEGCHFERETQALIVSKLASELKRRKALTNISASDENSIDDGVKTIQSFSKDAMASLARINVHSYWGTRRTELSDLANKNNLSLWMSEYGDGDASGIAMAKTILADVKFMKPTAWIYWQAVDDRSAGGWGALASDLNHPTDFSFVINPKYYVLGNFSEFIRPGCRFLSTDDPNALAAYDSEKKRLILVVVNGSNDPILSRYDISRFQKTGETAIPYRSSESEKLARLEPAPIGKDRVLACDCPPRTVTTLLIDQAEYQPKIAAKISAKRVGSGMNQMNFVGSWTNPDLKESRSFERRSDHPDDFVTIRFKGNQAYFWAKKGPTNGIAAFSVDSGGETEVDLHAPNLTGILPVYATPTLSEGEHVLKMRVTGRKNSASHSTSIPVSRIEIATGASD